ncbi:hypothetical protein JX265_004370 [Neoarthrinium moseri]|uniref:Uncharacterized protein n=1 Tax=Neoarthrinium moseri TaxID=1658444 RepID=A0A9P9WQS1_9PEZI|nr:hypothetical protein JX266_003942 [Neoarthrinium moseri]KAI1875312.1 hypothetical protein JX265_004370 [Neoarthrinium moseri]
MEGYCLIISGFRTLSVLENILFTLDTILPGAREAYCITVVVWAAKEFSLIRFARPAKEHAQLLLQLAIACLAIWASEILWKSLKPDLYVISEVACYFRHIRSLRALEG